MIYLIIYIFLIFSISEIIDLIFFNLSLKKNNFQFFYAILIIFFWIELIKILQEKWIRLEIWDIFWNFILILFYIGNWDYRNLIAKNIFQFIDF